MYRTNLILEEHDQALMEALQFMNPLVDLLVLLSVFVKEIINKKSSKIRR